MYSSNVDQRIEDFLKRKNIDLNENVKYRGKLRTSKWNVYESAQKRHLLSSLLNNMR